MKKFILIVTILIALFSLSTVTVLAQSPTPPPAPDAPPALPSALVVAITIGIGYLATQGVKDFTNLLQSLSQYKWFAWLGDLDLSGWPAWITNVVAMAVVFYLNNGIAALPPQYYPTVTWILAALVAVFTANGLHATIKKFQPLPLPAAKSK